MKEQDRFPWKKNKTSRFLQLKVNNRSWIEFSHRITAMRSLQIFQRVQKCYQSKKDQTSNQTVDFLQQKPQKLKASKRLLDYFHKGKKANSHLTKLISCGPNYLILNTMLEQSQAKQSQIYELISLKKWEEAETLIIQQPKSNDLMQNLINLYDKLSFADEDQYEQFLRILISAVDIKLDYRIYESVVTTVISQIISLSSAKYAIVIIRGLISQLQHNEMGVLAILANLFLFTGLIFDSTFAELGIAYQQFRSVDKKVKQQLQIQNQQNDTINGILMKTLCRLLKNILNQPKIINDSKKQIAILFVSRLIKDLKRELKSDVSYEQQVASIIGMPLNKISSAFLSLQQIDITKIELPLVFLQVIIDQQKSQQMLSYTASVLSQRSFTKIVLLMVCVELSNDLNTMPEISVQSSKLLAFSILKVVRFLHQQTQRDSYCFLSGNVSKIEQFVEKVNIFLGAIDPKEEMSKELTKRFSPLSFLPRQFKEKLLSKLIKKHKNESFKIHLISQYRKLLTFKTPKDTWIRSTEVLMKQFSFLQPKSSIDYIGHILSFAYYWKQVGNKLLQTSQVSRHIHIDTNSQMTILREKLVSLRNGLQDRLKLLQDQKKQLQRNEISVCLYRIQELLRN